MSFKRILVIKLKQPGDVLLSTPVIDALKEAWPQCHLTYLVPRGAEEMVAGHPGLDELLVVDRRGASATQALGFALGLKRRGFDLVLELSGGDRGALYTWLTRAKERLGFAHPGQPFWQRRACFTRLLPRPPLKMHMVQQNLEPLRALGLTPSAPRLSFFWDQAVEKRTRDLLAAHDLRPGNFVVMHPGAGWSFKCWTPAGYARLLEVLSLERGLPVVLTGSRAPLEQELTAAILRETRARPLNLVGQLSLKELGALIAQARFFFGVDSAPMHLAAAVGTPTAALFGPTGAFNWAPWGEGHLVIQQDWECLACGKAGCENSKVSRCLVELAPEEVRRRLEDWAPGGAAGKSGKVHS
jgi:heptosyltransferase-3